MGNGKLVCTEEEVAIMNCYNGGECFALDLGTSRTLACSCSKEYIGKQCGYFAIPPEVLATTEKDKKTLFISLALLTNLLVILLICLLLCFCSQRYKARMRERESEGNRKFFRPQRMWSQDPEFGQRLIGNSNSNVIPSLSAKLKTNPSRDCCNEEKISLTEQQVT